MEIIFHSPFFYGFFRMVSFPPMRHLERGYLPIWVKKLKLYGNASREISCRHALCTIGRQISLLRNAFVEITVGRSGIWGIQLFLYSSFLRGMKENYLFVLEILFKKYSIYLFLK